MIETPTAEVFGHFQGPFSLSIVFSGRRKSTAEWLADIKVCRNDLTDAAIAVTPEIRDVLAALSATPGCQVSRMSGSGATCFGIYNNAEAAANAASMLSAHYPEWWIVPAKLL